MCFDLLEIPSLEAIDFPADESVWMTMLTEAERIAELNSWMKFLIASDSTDAWVIA